MKQKTTLQNIMGKNKILNGSSTQIIELNPEHRNIGYADGININGALNNEEKLDMINKAAVKFGEFLDALGCDWKNDPNSKETPKRVAQAYVNDLWAGRYNPFPKITTFPNYEYDGIIFEGNIPIISMCSHHHQTIIGKAHIAYIPQINQEIIGFTSGTTEPPYIQPYNEYPFKGWGEMSIFHSSDGILDKPIFLVDGFDPNDT